jgi:glycosyltransferase involved in cell wall biosynthesis
MRDRLGIAADELAIAFVGRNHQEKGLDLLLGCLPRLEDLDRRTVVVLAGSGTDEILATHGARSRVIALGERNDVADLLRASDALVLPSRSEGTPNAVIEAMATAIPCVVTDVGDTADLVGETGIIVAMPTIEKLTQGLRELAATDPAERRHLGAAARERVITRHSPATAREAYRSLWHKDLR